MGHWKSHVDPETQNPQEVAQASPFMPIRETGPEPGRDLTEVPNAIFPVLDSFHVL